MLSSDNFGDSWKSAAKKSSNIYRVDKVDKKSQVAVAVTAGIWSGIWECLWDEDCEHRAWVVMTCWYHQRQQLTPPSALSCSSVVYLRHRHAAVSQTDRRRSCNVVHSSAYTVTRRAIFTVRLHVAIIDGRDGAHRSGITKVFSAREQKQWSVACPLPIITYRSDANCPIFGYIYIAIVVPEMLWFSFKFYVVHS